MDPIATFPVPEKESAQLDLPLRATRAIGAEGVTAADATQLHKLLIDQGWLTRRQISRLTGWSERQIRLLAEHLGDQIVRGPKGFAALDRAEMDEVLQAARIAIAQGKHMIRYGAALQRRLHARVG